MQQKSKTDTKKEQLDRFKQKAKELGCDDDEGRFNDRLKKIAKLGPKQDERRRQEPPRSNSATQDT